MSGNDTEITPFVRFLADHDNLTFSSQYLDLKPETLALMETLGLTHYIHVVRMGIDDNPIKTHFATESGAYHEIVTEINAALRSLNLFIGMSGLPELTAGEKLDNAIQQAIAIRIVEGKPVKPCYASAQLSAAQLEMLHATWAPKDCPYRTAIIACNVCPTANSPS